MQKRWAMLSESSFFEEEDSNAMNYTNVLRMGFLLGVLVTSVESVRAAPAIYQLFPGTELLEIWENTLEIKAGPVVVKGESCVESSKFFCLTDGAPIRFAVPREKSRIKDSWTVGGRVYRVTVPLHVGTVLGRRSEYCQITAIDDQEGFVTINDYLYSPELGLVAAYMNLDEGRDSVWLLVSEYGIGARARRR